MTIYNALQWATKQLKQAKINSASIDAEILLSFVLKKTKEFILTRPNNNLTIQQYNNFRRLINRRKKNEPIAYIIGEKEFYGLKFLVNKKVLIPRPETESIVDLVLKYLNNLTVQQFNNIILIDVGTGSGCIPIAIAKKLEEKNATTYRVRSHSICNTKIFATDISKKALDVAKENAKLHKVSKKITFLQGNLLEPFERYSKNIRDEIREIIITANLPYIPTSDWKKLPASIKNYEPCEALDGGTDGLKYYRKLFKQISALLARRSLGEGGSVFLEIDPRQKDALKKIILKNLPRAKIKFHKDLAGKWRTTEINM